MAADFNPLTQTFQSFYVMLILSGIAIAIGVYTAVRQHLSPDKLSGNLNPADKPTHAGRVWNRRPHLITPISLLVGFCLFCTAATGAHEILYNTPGPNPYTWLQPWLEWLKTVPAALLFAYLAYITRVILPNVELRRSSGLPQILGTAYLVVTCFIALMLVVALINPFPGDYLDTSFSAYAFVYRALYAIPLAFYCTLLAFLYFEAYASYTPHDRTLRWRYLFFGLGCSLVPLVVINYNVWPVIAYWAADPDPVFALGTVVQLVIFALFPLFWLPAMMLSLSPGPVTRDLGDVDLYENVRADLENAIYNLQGNSEHRSTRLQSSKALYKIMLAVYDNAYDTYTDHEQSRAGEDLLALVTILCDPTIRPVIHFDDTALQKLTEIHPRLYTQIAPSPPANDGVESDPTVEALTVALHLGAPNPTISLHWLPAHLQLAAISAASSELLRGPEQQAILNMGNSAVDAELLQIYSEAHYLSEHLTDFTGLA